MPLLPPGVSEQFPADPVSGQIDAAALTPLFRQYVELKREVPAAILFYRLGDFYETFGPDAVRAADILGLTLTARGCGNDYKVAMAGVPHHSSTRYIKRLVEAGEVVALCEQMEDPAQAKGLVARAITRVITAGTLVEDEYLSADSSNFLCVVSGAPSAPRPGQPSGLGSYGIAILESSGGRVDCFEYSGCYRGLLEQALRTRPAELLLPAALRRDAAFSSALSEALGGVGPAIHTYERSMDTEGARSYLLRFLGAVSLQQYGLESLPLAQSALFSLARYLEDTFRGGRLRLYPRHSPPSECLYLDSRVAAHLDLLGDGTPGVYGLLARCQGSLGRRELKRALLAPSADADEISRRHDSVQLLRDDTALSDALAEALTQIQDVERISMRIGLGRSNPRELRALADSLPALDELRALLHSGGLALLRELAGGIAAFSPLYLAINDLLSMEPPIRVGEGETVRPGADSEVDRLRELSAGGQEWFRAYEQQQRELTGIRNLKVKHTDAFGWFIELGKGSSELAPQNYQRRQTLVNAERYTTPELSAREAESKSADTKLAARERELYEGLCEQVSGAAAELCAAAQSAARADMLLALALTARELGWVRPELSADGSLSIEGGRHPLVEASVGSRYYTPNDCVLNAEDAQILLLTGPNMGGKSTYLRMVALLCALSQLGSFVPAQRAVLPVLRRIYTRVGAQDRIGSGQSTFMVEMVETAEILNTCGPGSLIILDEVGRGTSTYDGISIAKAVLEFLHEQESRPLTLFATHFFELTDLALLLPRLHNCQVEVARTLDPDTGEARYSFLYRVSAGAASDSYGIEVAALAGLPPAVVERARQILAQLEEAQREARLRAQKAVQLGLFG